MVYNMLLNTKVLKSITIVICAIFLSNCSKLATTTRAHTKDAQESDSQYTMPADAYLALANNQTGEDKQSLLLLAAGKRINDGQPKLALSILSQITPLSPKIKNEKYLLLAKIDLLREQPSNALTNLSNVNNISSLPIYDQLQFHEMLAFAYFISNHPLEAVHERIKLDKLLSGESAKTNNRLALWMALTKLSKAETRVLATEAPDNQSLNGWIQLANISKTRYKNPQRMLENIQVWQENFPNHPGNYILPKDLNQAKELLFTKPKKIAVLLPLTGQLSGPANAIKDGIMAAYEKSPNRYNVNIETYNTNSDNIKNLYNKAIEDGANYIIGPLSKADVNEVASLNHPVPTLLLNNSEESPSPNAYQFGLSPTNEARQVAVKIHKKGLHKALIIAPIGTWGKDIVEAFSKQFRNTGGEVIESLYYTPETDLTSSIRELLHVAANDATRKKTEITDNQEPLRREDFDVIFVVAYPTKASQILPLLRYYYAGNVPVYSTSNAYSGSINTMKDRDLDDLIFCDMPWIFNHQISNRNWPEQFNSYNRLYALGMDSYNLATQLNKLLLFPAMGINNQSGVIYLNNNQEISRILVFGSFQNGVAKVRPYL
jgi:outer membrane PBP1 activator LpoA protein